MPYGSYPMCSSDRQKPKLEAKKFKVPKFMQAGMIMLAVLVVLVGIYPTFFLNLIGTVHFI